MKKGAKQKKSTHKHKVQYSRRKYALIVCISLVTGLFAYGAVCFALMPLQEHAEQSTTKKYSDYKIEIPQDTPDIQQSPESAKQEESTAPQSTSQSSNARQMSQYEIEKNKIELYKTTCQDPMAQINTTFLNTQETANNRGWSEKGAIQASPGTEQFRTSYNSVAFNRNFTIELAYSTYKRSINDLNTTMKCNVSPAYQKYGYWEMLNSSSQYIPYLEGSSLSSY